MSFPANVKSRLLSQRAGSPLFFDRRAGLPGTMSQACAGGPRWTDQRLESMRWVGVAGSRAFSLSDPTARGETV